MKIWASDVQDHIENWSNRLGNLRWWPRYVYHFADVRNAASILREDQLLCRAEASRRDLLRVDSASPEIIQGTRPDHLSYARLYFRPRTPTQFRNEGIRPLGQRSLDAHCPMPVYFFFDALQVLTRDDTEFSDGNMASPRARHSGDRDFFLNLPFNQIFHNTRFLPEERDDIVFRRNAEVLVPNSLPLAPALKFIVCRTVAERQTLLYLMAPAVRKRWEPKTRLQRENLFERRWTFVEEVVVVEDSITFRFNPSTGTPGPFLVRFSYTEHNSEYPRIWEGRVSELNGPWSVRVVNANWGVVELFLDDALAFAGRVVFADIPF